jgi:hypothetical protein
MTKPFDALIPKPKLGRSRVQNITTKEVETISLALLNEIAFRKQTFKSNPEQINQGVFHLALAYSELKCLSMRMRKLQKILKEPLKARVVKAQKALKQAIKELPLRVQDDPYGKHEWVGTERLGRERGFRSG